MRVCYHIQSHRAPNHLTRLVRTIKQYSPDSVVFVSHDVRGAAIDEAELRSMPDVAVQYHMGGYGDFNHIDRYLSGIEWLLRERVAVDWLVNLTGQAYPVMPLQHAEDELLASGADGFVEHWEVLGPDAHWPHHRGRSRYHFRHRRLARLSPRAARTLRPLQVLNHIQPLARVHTSYGLTVGWRSRPPADLRLYGGNFCVSLRWPVAVFLRDFLLARPDVVAHFRRCLSPEEALIQSVLCSKGNFSLVNDCKRFFDFGGSHQNHSRVLTTADVAPALASGAHFALKLDHDSDPAPLDLLDAQLALIASR